MRIIPWLAAGVAAMAIGEAAAAQSGAGFARQGGEPAGARAPGGHQAGTGGHGHVRPGIGKGDRRHGRSGRFERYPPYPHAYAIAGPIGEAGPYGSGFFAGGGQVRLRDGQPYYDYDRSYPYDWAPAAAGAGEWKEEMDPGGPQARCTVENRVRVCRGGPRPMR